MEQNKLSYMIQSFKNITKDLLLSMESEIAYFWKLQISLWQF